MEEALEQEEAAEREPMPGESEYALARQMSRHTIPDFETDGEYLTLLGKSAALGFPRALAKLGDYALRRGAKVEAYFWLWKARLHGMSGLDSMLHKIRKRWVEGGYPAERYNRHDLFEEEDAAAALALLDLSAGRNRLDARAFLEEHFPDLIEGR